MDPLRPRLPFVALVFGLACGSRADDAAAVRAIEPAVPAAATVPSPAPGAAPAEPTVEAAPESPDLPDFSDTEWKHVESRAGTYSVRWRAEPELARNQDVSLVVWVLRDGKPVGREALLGVTGWMPDHGHGMLRRTNVQRLPDGSFRVDGVLLHMRGRWQLFFETIEGTLAETAEYVLDL